MNFRFKNVLGLDVEALQDLLPFLRPFKRDIVLTIFFITVGVVINIILPILIRDLTQKEHINLLPYTLVILFLLYTYHVSSCFGHFRAGKIGRLLYSDLSSHALRRINDMSFTDAVSNSPEVLASQITQGAQNAGDCITGALTDFYQSVIYCICFTFGLIYLSPHMCMILALVAILNKVVTSFLSCDLTSKSHELQCGHALTLKNLVNVLSLQSTVRLFSLQKITEKRLDSELQEACTLGQMVDWKMHSSSGTMFCLNNTLYIFLIVAARFFKDAGELNDGDLFVFFFFVKRWLDHVSDIGKQLAKVRLVAGSTQTLRSVIKASSCPHNKIVGKRNTDSGTAALVADKIQFSYGTQNISMTLNFGHLYGIIGKSGEGKTTTMRLLTSLLTPTKGSVNRTHSVMLCEQDAGILTGTIHENIAFGTTRAVTREEVKAAARRACFDTVVESLPNSYDTLLRCGGEIPLSGGQIQRLCIARAFLSDAHIMIFDEPTKGLDSAGASYVISSLHEFVKEGRVVIVVTHALKIVEKATKIFLIHNGVIASEGTHEELEKECSQYRELLQRD